MSYPQQPGNWSDPSWPSQQPAGPEQGSPVSEQSYPVSGEPVYKDGYPAPTSGYPAPGYPPAGYPTPAPGYGYPVAPSNNGMAIASMVVSIVGVLGLCGYGLGGYIGIVGAILGHVSRKQIRERGEQGDGMALAGIILGWIATGIAVLATIAIVIFFVWIANQDPSTFDSGY